MTLIACSCIILFYALGEAMSIFDFNKCNLYLTPAPWRKWMQTREEIIEDWHSGKDFKISEGPYCSIRDIEYIRSNFNRAYIVYDRGTIEV